MGGGPRRRCNRTAAAPASEGFCAFCGSDDQEETTVGRLYSLENTTVHYYCALVSCGLVQNGHDEEGLFGFLHEDIQAELQRGKKLKCSYCGCYGATVGCNVRECRKQFHLPCGRRRGALSLFYGNYQSFCISHAPTQNIPENILTKARVRQASAKKPAAVNSALSDDKTAGEEWGCEEATCAICYDAVDSWPSNATFWPPCCARDRWLHTQCLQRMALSAGMHYFKCPLCNDRDTFQTGVQQHGVYIPDRDAAWELEERAFAELYERPKACSADNCLCSHGREYDSDEGQWELKRCVTCGSVAAHAGCLPAGAARLICVRCGTVPPPCDLDALERIPLTPVRGSNVAESESPEYRPLMSHRMSLRRTKPQASTSGPCRDAFPMDRVVKICRTLEEKEEEDDVDIISLDIGSSNMIVTSTLGDGADNVRDSRLSIGIRSLRLTNTQTKATENEQTGKIVNTSSNKKNMSILKSVLRDNQALKKDTASPMVENLSKDKTNVENLENFRNAVIAMKLNKGKASESLNIHLNMLDLKLNKDSGSERLKKDVSMFDLNLNKANTSEILKKDVFDCKVKVLRKNTLSELEDRILSPLKIIEEKICAQLSGNKDPAFRSSLENYVRRLRRPRPMCAKKKIIGTILEKINEDCAKVEKHSDTNTSVINDQMITPSKLQCISPKDPVKITRDIPSVIYTSMDTGLNKYCNGVTDQILCQGSSTNIAAKSNSEDKICGEGAMCKVSEMTSQEFISEERFDISKHDGTNIANMTLDRSFESCERESVGMVRQYVSKRSKTRNKKGNNKRKRKVEVECANKEKIDSANKKRVNRNTVNHIEYLKSHYLSEVDRSYLKSSFNDIHETNLSAKPQLKSAIDIAIEAAVKKRQCDRKKTRSRESPETNKFEDKSDPNKNDEQDQICPRNFSISKNYKKNEISKAYIEPENDLTKLQNSLNKVSVINTVLHDSAFENVIKKERSKTYKESQNTLIKLQKELNKVNECFEKSKVNKNAVCTVSQTPEIIDSVVLPKKSFPSEKRIIIFEETILVSPSKAVGKICTPKISILTNSPISSLSYVPILSPGSNSLASDKQAVPQNTEHQSVRKSVRTSEINLKESKDSIDDEMASAKIDRKGTSKSKKLNFSEAVESSFPQKVTIIDSKIDVESNKKVTKKRKPKQSVTDSENECKRNNRKLELKERLNKDNLDKKECRIEKPAKKRNLIDHKNEPDRLEMKRQRKKVDYSEHSHDFIVDLLAADNYYLKLDNKKDIEENRTHIKEQEKTISCNKKVLKQSVLNFSPETKREVQITPPVQKKRKKKSRSPDDGLKQTTLNSFFAVHLTLT